MIGIRSFLVVVTALGYAVGLVAAAPVITPAQGNGALSQLALTLEDIRFQLEDLDLPDREAKIANVTATVSRIGASNGKPYDFSGLYTRAQQYGLLSSIFNLAYSEKALLHQAIRERQAFKSATATAAWKSFITSIYDAGNNFNAKVDDAAPEVATQTKGIIASLFKTLDQAAAAYGR